MWWRRASPDDAGGLKRFGGELWARVRKGSMTFNDQIPLSRHCCTRIWDQWTLTFFSKVWVKIRLRKAGEGNSRIKAGKTSLQPQFRYVPVKLPVMSYFLLVSHQRVRKQRICQTKLLIGWQGSSRASAKSEEEYSTTQAALASVL